MSRVYVVRLIRNYFSDFLATTRLCLLLCIWDTPIVSEATAVRQGPYLGAGKTLQYGSQALANEQSLGR